jgi:tetratricopeptide (TPR) repeat protein
MTTDQGRRAEEWLGWHPLPDPPRHFRRALASAGRELADYMLSGDRSAQRRLAGAIDRIVQDQRFPAAPTAFRAALLNRAGIAHNWCGVRETDETELGEACRLLAAGLELAADVGVERARLEYNLGNTLLNLYQINGDSALLAEAVSYARRAVRHAGPDRRLAALTRTGLASALRVDFRVRGDLSVLEEAVDHAEQAVRTAKQTPLGHRFQYVLADVLSVRYDVRGSLDDLNRAIALLQEAAEVHDPTMAPGANKPFNAAMATLLRSRYLRTRDPADIDEAIRLLAEALGDGTDANPAILTNLGNALLNRYDDCGEQEDLFPAVDLQQQAVSRTPPGDWQLASRYNNAGNALKAAWRATGDPELGERAVSQYRESLRLTAENAPERASREYNLAGSLHRQCVENSDTALIGEAVSAFRRAVHHGLNSSLEWALSAAHQWGAWAVARESWDEAGAAYAQALDAVDRLFRIQLLRADKETWLAESQGLPAEAAYAMVRAGRAKEAVVALETGQSLLLSEILERDRADLERLRHRRRAHRRAFPYGDRQTRSRDAQRCRTICAARTP